MENQAQGMDSRTKYALVGTSLYVVFFVCLSVSNWTDFSSLKLNELGDYLAGVFGPLALFWVVIGYFQQGEELRSSTTELARSVDALKRQADTAQKRYDAEQAARDLEQERYKRDISPNFKLTVVDFSDNAGVRVGEFQLVNRGAAAREVEVKVHEVDQVERIHSAIEIAAGGVVTFKNSWKRHAACEEVEPVTIEITYLDLNFEYGSSEQKFRIMRAGGNGRGRTIYSQ